MAKQYETSEKTTHGMKVSEQASPCGGAWTVEKLNAFEKYVDAYLTIMNKYRGQYDWKLIYFDGFAGSGSRNEETFSDENQLMIDLIDEHQITAEELSPYKGAAELQQMKTIFKYATEEPLVLCNTRNTPIFLSWCKDKRERQREDNQSCQRTQP